jgi:NADH:quinone reductase (non-electrogenic)
VAHAPRVLVLGGGFATAGACKTLRPAIEQGDVEVTVVSRTNYSCLHGLIAEMITGRISPGAIASPARRVFAPAHIHVAEIESIDLDAHRVVTSRSIDGARRGLEFDHAILALGCGENLDAYPGLREHAFKLKSFEDSLRLRNHIVEMFELADSEPDPEERRRLLTFFIAGGGYSGSEVAGELADYARLLTRREYKGLDESELRIIVVHPGPTLLPELYGSGNLERVAKSYPKLVEFGTRHIEKLGVELMLETRVVGATPTDVYLNDGTHVPTRTIISTVGTKPNPLLDTLAVERDSRGRVVTDEFLRVKGREDVWAVGDCASIAHPDGGTCPPVALYAEQQGLHVGANVARAARGESLKPYRRAVRMQGISIGGRTAVGEIHGIGLKGRMPWIVWRIVISRVVPSWDRRIRIAIDWMLWPLVGRDIVQVGPSERDDYDVRHNVFQPGETLVERDRPVRFVHIIVEGDADLLQDGETVGALGTGDHCGRKWLELRGADAVRARTLVRTVSLRADEANRLQDVLLSTQRIIATTGAHATFDLGRLRESEPAGSSPPPASP